MKILTWNINGIRASKAPLNEVFKELDADIICLQETKVTRDMLDEPSAIVENYNSYFSFCKTKSGYSGVATFVRNSATPFRAEEGLSGLLASDDEKDNIGCYGDQSQFSDEELQSLDNEGRTIITQHKILTDEGEEELLTVINVYCPMAKEDEERRAFKQRFYELLQIRAETLLASESHVIILGDINTSHRQIDHCDPSEISEFEKHPGRIWLNQLLWDSGKEQSVNLKNTPSKLNTSEGSISDVSKGHKFLDSFRYFHPDQKEAFTCWSTVTGARATNFGTRIDYILGDIELVKKGFQDCVIRPDIEGSDHCPVKATLNWECLASKKCPPLCSKYLPEFTGKQQKLSSYFSAGVKPSSQLSQLTKSSSDGESSMSSSQGSSDSQPVAPFPSSSQKSLKTNTQGASVGGLKRSSSGQSSTKFTSKKIKTEDKKPSGGNQRNLLSFFGKGKPAEVKVTETSHHPSPATTSKSEPQVTKDVTTSSVNTNTSKSTLPGSQGMKSQNTDTVSSWKSLLKGPPPAPLCEGHKEPCVLRTVKKDSLNKGRQFWVCYRPEGHKSNKEARCEHFTWVDKKKASGKS